MQKARCILGGYVQRYTMGMEEGDGEHRSVLEGLRAEEIKAPH
jgi:hypothetical protein